MPDGYLTRDQSIYVGDATALTDLGRAANALDLSAPPRLDRFPALGRRVPTLTVTQITWTLTLPAVRGLTDADVPSGHTLVLVREDDLRCLVVPAVVIGGLPRQAPPGGVIQSNLTAQPGEGGVIVATGLALDDTAATVSVTDGQAWVVAVTGTGTVTRGSESVDVAAESIAAIPGTDTSISIPAGIEGWLIHSGEAA